VRRTNSRQFRIKGHEIVPVRRSVVRAQVMRQLMQDHQFTHGPGASVAIVGNGDGRPVSITLVMGGRRSPPGTHRDGSGRPSGRDEVQHLIDIALHRFDRREPCLGRQGQPGAEEIDIPLAVTGRPLEHGAHKLFGRVYLGALGITWMSRPRDGIRLRP
jgi:hypothetical protein